MMCHPDRSAAEWRDLLFQLSASDFNLKIFRFIAAFNATGRITGVSSMACLMFASLAVLALAASPLTTHAQSSAPTKELPPKTWVDKDTGHRVWRISEELDSGAFYFNIN